MEGFGVFAGRIESDAGPQFRFFSYFTNRRKIISFYTSDDAQRERLEEAAGAATTVRVMVWHSSEYGDGDPPRGETLLVTETNALICQDQWNGLRDTSLAYAWKLLDIAQERAQKVFEQAQRDLAACKEIRQRLDKVREFPAPPTRRTGPFAFLLDRIREEV